MPEISPEPTPSSTPIAKSLLQPGRFYSPVLGRNFEYQVYLPADYQNSRLSYPVMYLLHGRGDSMYGWLYIHTDLDEMIAKGSIPPIIAVLPDVPSSKGGSYFVDSSYTLEPLRGENVETAFIQDLIPHIDATYRTLPSRNARLVAGYSMGGYAAVRYPLAHPDLFSATIILSPAVYVPLPPAGSSARLFGAFGRDNVIFDEEVWREKNYPALLPSFEAMEMPLYAFIAVGDDEWRNPSREDIEHDLDFEAARLYNQLVHTRYVVAQFRVLDGGHDWDVWQPAFIEGLTWVSRFLDRPTP
jgi:enterochelin esterase-like enzyme